MRVFTNSETVANRVEQALESALATAWNDPLAVGQVTMGYDLNLFARERAAVYATFHWDEDAVAEQDLAERGVALQQAIEKGEPICLLFGPSLADQLALAQIGAWLSFQPQAASAQISLSVSGSALEAMDVAAIGERLEFSKPINIQALDLYRSAWLAFVSPDPRYLEAFLGSDATPPGDALAGAIARLACEYPSVENGLSLTECQTLDAIRLGVAAPRDLFAATREAEEHPFLRDWDFWLALDRLSSGEQPLIRKTDGTPFICPPRDFGFECFDDQAFELTEHGAALLDGRAHWSQSGRPDRWIGGAHLTSDSCWYWDYAEKRFTQEFPALA